MNRTKRAMRAYNHLTYDDTDSIRGIAAAIAKRANALSTEYSIARAYAAGIADGKHQERQRARISFDGLELTRGSAQAYINETQLTETKIAEMLAFQEGLLTPDELEGIIDGETDVKALAKKTLLLGYKWALQDTRDEQQHIAGLLFDKQ